MTQNLGPVRANVVVPESKMSEVGESAQRLGTGSGDVIALQQSSVRPRIALMVLAPSSPILLSLR